jgi:hypothetical protein
VHCSSFATSDCFSTYKIKKFLYQKIQLIELMMALCFYSSMFHWHSAPFFPLFRYLEQSERVHALPKALDKEQDLDLKPQDD